MTKTTQQAKPIETKLSIPVVNGCAPLNAEAMNNLDTTRENKRYSGLSKPGMTNNPNGRPKGTRNKLSEKFLDDLREVWEQATTDDNGLASTIGRDVCLNVAKSSPEKLLTAMVAVLPKDFQITVTDEQQWVINAQPLSVEDWQAEHGLDKLSTGDNE
ncbi:MAG: hypothetical protein KOO63_08145 [Bacteroidales bacterium]|nr:hypothetical protein [Candidatus Latescibacterota bacterium]